MSSENKMNKNEKCQFTTSKSFKRLFEKILVKSENKGNTHQKVKFTSNKKLMQHTYGAYCKIFGLFMRREI